MVRHCSVSLGVKRTKTGIRLERSKRRSRDYNPSVFGKSRQSAGDRYAPHLVLERDNDLAARVRAE